MPLVLMEDLAIFKRQDGLLEHLTVDYVHENILLHGRYNKYSREISQTPWSVDGKTLKLGSVQCHLEGPLKEVFGADQGILHGSGREDIDVRMLGRGRPFIMEFVNPKKAVSCYSRVPELNAMV